MQESMMQGCKETGEATNTKWDHYSIFDFSFDKSVKNLILKNAKALMIFKQSKVFQHLLLLSIRT